MRAVFRFITHAIDPEGFPYSSEAEQSQAINDVDYSEGHYIASLSANCLLITERELGLISH